MNGTILNVITIIAGGILGVLAGKRLPERVKQTMLAVMGLFIIALGIQMFLKTENALICLSSLIIGGILGEWWQIEESLTRLGAWLEKKFNRSEDAGSSGKFIHGFLAASLVFCIGPIAILGPVQDGLAGDIKLLAVKSTLDFFFSLSFASSLGIGVAFSAIPVFIYQGLISLLAIQVQTVTTTPMINEMTAAGGVVLIGIGLSSILEIKKIRTGNLLPAPFIAPLIVAILSLLRIGI
jgi:uncharacterized membrane protein YqgA involved in biofilm formation